MPPEQTVSEGGYLKDSDIPMHLKKRNFVIFMLFLGMANAYVMRTNMSVAIVAMVNHSAIGSDHHHSQGGEFGWSYKTQGYILSSFFYGYVLTQIPFGFLIKYYGAKQFLGWGMMLNSVAAFVVPVSAREGGPVPLGIVRFIQGLGEGPIVPCTHSMLALWIPPDERSRAGAAVYAGAQFGTIVSMPLSGLLAEYGFDGGWPSIFYVFGILTTVWCVLFLWLVHESPKSCKGISQTECKYIDDSIWEAQPEDTGRTPFLAFARSRFFWAIMVAHAGQNYGYETLMTMLPTYMDRILGLFASSSI
ncbi:putative inorganic phosphate cotransporter [Drosophila guanche]|uniref:putative inorganic phosphate cotransporter n=1 Tax=Drosophila guanche TaxID=7266 RepID=UPI001471AD06|nr:putative inorganic phosphate cotransporter [Drosophila guanche]